VAQSFREICETDTDVIGKASLGCFVVRRSAFAVEWMFSSLFVFLSHIRTRVCLLVIYSRDPPTRTWHYLYEQKTFTIIIYIFSMITQNRKFALRDFLQKFPLNFIEDLFICITHMLYSVSKICEKKRYILNIFKVF